MWAKISAWLIVERGKKGEREGTEKKRGGISSAPLCDWKFNRGTEIEGERKGRRERWMGGGERGGGGKERQGWLRVRGRERERESEGEREAKGTETSLLWSFQQKLAVANNARHDIQRAGGMYISRGSFWNITGPPCPLTFSASRGKGKLLGDVVFWPSDARWRAATTAAMRTFDPGQVQGRT